MAAETRSALTILECPNCGSPINQFNATTQSVVCPKCGSTVAIGVGDPELISKGRRLPKPPRPIVLGGTAKIANKNYVVLGRIVYRGTSEGETFTWNEWMMGAESGQILWLSFDENGFGLFRKVRFRQPFDASKDRNLNLGDKSVVIRERYPAEIIGTEGELTWRAKPGDKLFVAEGVGRGGLHYSIQQTPKELEIYEGRHVGEKDLAQSFNDAAWLKAIEAGKNRAATLKAIAVLCIVAAIIAVFTALFVNATGDEVQPQIVELSSTTPRDSFEVMFDSPRPAVIGVKLLTNISGGLPENSFIDIDMEITSPDGTKDELFSQELWHETGRDEDGPWRETKYATSDMFVPTQAGSHTLDVSYDGSVLSSLTLEVTVRRNHVMPTWFFIYAVITGVLGVLALAASSPQTTMNIISNLMDD